MKRLALAFVFVLGFAPSAWADFRAGSAAFNRGDYATALREWKPLAEQGNVRAQARLGNLYRFGLGAPRDSVAATKWYRLAAEQGDVGAAWDLALMYYDGEEVPQDYAEAAKWFHRAAGTGNVLVQSKLGWIYAEGEGVAQDYAAAVKWYRLAAEQGFVTAQFNLGVMYRNGDGVLQDYTEAVKWYRKAAEQGHADAQFRLGEMYRHGEGVPQDYNEALKWYRKAAEQGDAAARINLGFMYGKGQGVPQDYVQAHKWYNIAASRLPSGEDRDLAVKNRDIVAPKMTAAQIAEAQRLARAWMSKEWEASNAVTTLRKLTLLVEAERRGTLSAYKKAYLDEARRRGLIPGDQVMKPASPRETIEIIQTSLAVLGYKPGVADGILGPLTRQAIEVFQRDEGLPVTGDTSRNLRFRLLLALEKKRRETANRNPTKVEPSD